MTNKELLNNNKEGENHDITGKEFADNITKGELDTLKQKVHTEHNNEQIEIEHELNEVKSSILLQNDKKEYIPTSNIDSKIAIANQKRNESKDRVITFGNNNWVKKIFGDLSKL